MRISPLVLLSSALLAFGCQDEVASTPAMTSSPGGDATTGGDSLSGSAGGTLADVAGAHMTGPEAAPGGMGPSAGLGEPVSAPPPPGGMATGGAAAGGDMGAGGTGGAGGASPPGVEELCFSDIAREGEHGPQYDPYSPILGSHCSGTNHQDITGVQRVVFLGDSVTQGTPNPAHLLSVDNSHFYRNLLAEWLTTHFGLDQGDPISFGLWKTYDYLSGNGGMVHAGDFSNCSKWGARTDDFLGRDGQITRCFEGGGSDKVTLVVFTMGGNDISKITQLGGEADAAEVALGYPQAWDLARSTVEYLENAVAWLKDPARFPNGSHVIFANPFEFTDGTGRVDACTPQEGFEIPGIGNLDLSQFDLNLAELGGYAEWADPDEQADIVIWILEQYMRIAVENQADMAFMLESFCGHGYVATGPNGDPEARCYRGPNTPLWFDITCIHPNDAGHQAIFELFRDLVTE